MVIQIDLIIFCYLAGNGKCGYDDDDDDDMRIMMSGDGISDYDLRG